MILLKGILIGLSIAAPVGPIGVLCIQRTLAYGRKSGFWTGLGAATADGIYGLLAGFSLITVSNFLLNQQVLLRVAGGGFLFYLALKTLQAKTSLESARKNKARGAGPDYFSALALTLANPATILSFAGVFAGVGVGDSPRLSDAGLMTGGVFLGSMLWWILLSYCVSVLGKSMNPKFFDAVRKISASLLMFFALLAWFSVRRAG